MPRRGDHPTVKERHERRLAIRRQQQRAAQEHPSTKFVLTTAGGIKLHKGRLSFSNARIQVRVQAEAGRQIWVREVAGAPSLIMELSHKGHLHVYPYGSASVLPFTPERVPGWAIAIHAEYINHYPGGIARG